MIKPNAYYAIKIAIRHLNWTTEDLIGIGFNKQEGTVSERITHSRFLAAKYNL